MIKGLKKIVFAMSILAASIGYGDSIVALPLSKIWDTNEVYTAAQVDKKVSEGVGNGGGGALADALADDTVMLMEEWVDPVAADEDKCAFPPEIYFTSSMFGMTSNNYVRSFTVVTASSPEYLPLVPVWCELRDTNDTVLATSLKEICTNTSSVVRFTFSKAISIPNTKSLYKVRFNWEGYQDITQFESNKVFGVRVKVDNNNVGPYMLEYGQTHHNWHPQMTVTYGTGTTIVEFTDATVQDVLSTLDARITELKFQEWYPDGAATSEADFTTNLLFDVANKDAVNHTIKVCPFAGGTDTNNSHLVGRIVIPPYVDIAGERYTVTGVAGQVLSGQNENLTSIIAPTTVKTIGDNAFGACKALEEASFPGVTTIGELAFGDCSSLEALDFPELLEVGEAVFAGCERAEILNLPKAITMGTDAFYACYGLKEASLPALTNLLGEAFIGCTNLTSVYAPSAIYVERKAFQSCTSLKEIVLDKALEVDQNAFEQCSSLETISLPSVKVIDSYAFRRCSSLKSISMPLVERLIGGSFSQCIALETIALPNAITIGDNAFNGCTNLTSVILPSAQTIGAASFGNCKALIAIDLPNVKSVGGGAFDNCVYLQSASLPLATITSDGIFKFCVALEDVNIPKATLLEDTFQGCPNLKKVSLPNVVEIANLDMGLDYNYTFHGCQNLTLIDFGDTVRSTIPHIGSQTFYNVPTNCVIVVPDFQYVEWTTTNGWENLVAAGYKFYRHSEWEYMHRFEFEEAKEPLKAEIVTMADEIRLRLAEWYPDGSVISESQYTDGIKYDIENRDSANLTIETLPFCNTGSTDDDNSNLVGNVIIPPYVEIYGTNYTVVGVATASGIDDDSTSITSIIAPTTVTNIGGSAIANCSSLKEISFPAVLRVFPGAFRECPSLTTISLPSCEAIGNWAFQECTNLTTVALSSSLQLLSPAAFLTCTSLEVVNFGAKPFASIPSVGSSAFDDAPTSCVFVIPDEQYDDWTATSGWSELVEEGYKFVRYSEWEYAHRYELPKVKVAAYALPDECFPVKYLTQAGDTRPYVIDSNDGLMFQDAAMGIEIYAYDASVAGGYGPCLGYFDSTTKKWSSIGQAYSITFNKDGVDTAPTANTWPILIANAPFVCDVQVAKESDVAEQMAGKVPTTRTVNNKALSTDITLDSNDINYEGTGLTQTLTETIDRLDEYKVEASAIAPDFTAKSYEKNELCSYNGVVYRCKSTYTATAQSIKPNSDTTHWEAKKVSELFLPLTGGTLKPGYLALEDGTGYKRVLRCNGTGGDFFIDYYNTQGTLLGSISVPPQGGQLALINSPTFMGRPTVPDMDAQSTNGQVANKKYVDNSVSGKANTTNLPYDIATKTITNNAVTVSNRTINKIANPSANFTVVLPTGDSAKSRDFYLAIECDANPPTSIVVTNAILQTANGTPATLTLEANKTNILHFTEIDNGNLAANPPSLPTFLVTGGANDGGSQPIFEPDVDGNRTAFTVGERCPVNDSIYTPITDPDTGEYIEVSGLVGKASFSAGERNAATGMCSTAFGISSAAAGDYSAAFGNSYAAGERSFSQGESSALGYYAHAEGMLSEARGSGSHTEGYQTRTFGASSHAEGYFADAYGDSSHVEGSFTIASNQYEHAEGVYNLTHMQEGLSNPSNTLMSVGCGTSISTRTNAVEVLLGGKTYIKGVGNYNGTNPYDVGVKDLAAAINDKLESPLANQSFDLSITSDLYSAISNIVEVLGGTITGMPPLN